MMSSAAEEDPEEVARTAAGLKGAGKAKRVRQRVDAGEPRNSYASIPNFSSRPPPGSLQSLAPFAPLFPSVNGFASKMLCDLLGTTRQLNLGKERPDTMILTDTDQNGGLNGSSPVSATSPNGPRAYLNGGPCPHSPERCSSEGSSSNSHLLRDILQQGRKRGEDPSGGHAPETTGQPCRNEETLAADEERMSSGAPCCDVPNDEESSSSSRDSDTPWQQDSQQQQQQPVSNGVSSSLESKRARVETIVSNMLQAPRGHGAGGGGQEAPQVPVNGCKKRKLYQPQQHETPSRPVNGDASSYDDDEEFDDGPLAKQSRRSNGGNNVEMFTFRQQLRQMQQQLVAMQQQYMEMVDGDSTDEEDVRQKPKTTDDSDFEDHKPRIDNKQEVRTALKPFMDYDNASMYDEQRRLIIDDDEDEQKETSACEDENPKSEIHRQSCIVQPVASGPPDLDIDWLAESIKAELSSSLAQVVDAVVSRCRQKAMNKHTTNGTTNGNNNSNGGSLQDPHHVDSSKDPTLLSQMLDRKSPRTKVIDRGTRVNGHGLCGLRTSPYPQAEVTSVPKPPFFFPLKPPASVAATAAFLYGSPPHNLPSLSMSYGGGGHSPLHSTPTPQQDAPEQTEAMSLVVTPKKKRHKVTDTRMNQGRQSLCGLPMRSHDTSSQDDSPPKYMMPEPMPMYSSHHHAPPPPPPPPLVPVSLPTTVAIPNPSLNQSDLFHSFAYDHHRLSAHYSVSEGPDDDGPPMGLHHSMAMHPLLSFHGHQRGSPDSLHMSHMKQDSGDLSDAGDSPAYDSSMPMISFLPMHTSTLTPMHLRKAKLMFFYARYPSSAVLKMYFPDIKFNKNNTAQLVKWFSNFREFFYIQMEKYARQAMSEGVKASDDLKVNVDSELLRVLNLHYNRNNHIEAPENFRFVVEQTLREFYKALVAGKDSEQSWKKSIYKIIARMDDNVPEYFKSPNFLETLE